MLTKMFVSRSAQRLAPRIRSVSPFSHMRHLCNSVPVDDSQQQLQQPQYSKILFLGPPGSGKGTYAKRICAMTDGKPKTPESSATGLLHLSPGELIRTESKAGTALGEKAAQYTRAGELLPVDLITRIMAGSLSGCHDGFLLDGFPRNLEQAEMLDALTDLDLVVHISMREDALKAKLVGRRVCPECNIAYNIADVNLNGGKFAMPPMLPTEPRCISDRCVDRFEQREDDTLPVIERRLQIYAKDTRQLVDYYRPRGIVRDVLIEGGEAVMMPLLKKLIGIR